MKSLAVALVLGVIGVTSCTKSSKTVAQVTPKEVVGLLNNKFAILVDVREEDEIAEGMAAEAVWLPLSKIQAEAPEWKQFTASLSKDKQVVFYCRSGGRAGFAAEQVLKLGYKAANMGSFDDWKDAGLPIKKP